MCVKGVHRNKALKYAGMHEEIDSTFRAFENVRSSTFLNVFAHSLILLMESSLYRLGARD